MNKLKVMKMSYSWKKHKPSKQTQDTTYIKHVETVTISENCLNYLTVSQLAKVKYDIIGFNCL